MVRCENGHECQFPAYLETVEPTGETWTGSDNTSVWPISKKVQYAVCPVCKVRLP
jgi:hypothetical protein